MTRNLAVIGLGYWGPNLVRAFAQGPGVRVAGPAGPARSTARTSEPKPMTGLKAPPIQR